MIFRAKTLATCTPFPVWTTSPTRTSCHTGLRTNLRFSTNFSTNFSPIRKMLVWEKFCYYNLKPLPATNSCWWCYKNIQTASNKFKLFDLHKSSKCSSTVCAVQFKSRFLSNSSSFISIASIVLNMNVIMYQNFVSRSSIRVSRNSSGLARKESPVAGVVGRSQGDDRKCESHRHPLLHGIQRKSEHKRILGEHAPH